MSISYTPSFWKFSLYYLSYTNQLFFHIINTVLNFEKLIEQHLEFKEFINLHISHLWLKKCLWAKYVSKIHLLFKFHWHWWSSCHGETLHCISICTFSFSTIFPDCKYPGECTGVRHAGGAEEAHYSRAHHVKQWPVCT